MIGERRLMLSDVEKQVMRSFMKAHPVDIRSYAPNDPARTAQGVPQGTSISLVLANLAASRLDRRLERIGVGFARYADDTLIWSDSYDAICDAGAILSDEAKAMGVELNHRKSEGISLLVPRRWERDGEMRTKRSVRFLGYDLGLDHCDISEAGERRIRKRCESLIYDNLLREPLKGNQDLARLSGPVDSDYIALLAHLRRYLYGSLSEAKVKRFQHGEAPFVHFEGVMASYPLIENSEVLSRFDGWIVHAIHQAMKKRGRILVEAGLVAEADLPKPHGGSAAELLSLGRPVSATSGRLVDVSVPSIRRIASVITRAAREYGAGAVGAEPSLGASNVK
jgi:hypothetical protein